MAKEEKDVVVPTDNEEEEEEEVTPKAPPKAKGGKGKGKGGRPGDQPGRWTDEEHLLFLKGLELYGKSWKKISEIVTTRTVVQIRTHAQKYLIKLEKAKKQGMTGVVMMDGKSVVGPVKGKGGKEDGSGPTGTGDLTDSETMEAESTDGNDVPRTPTGEDAPVSFDMQHDEDKGRGKRKRQPPRRLAQSYASEASGMTSVASMSSVVSEATTSDVDLPAYGAERPKEAEDGMGLPNLDLDDDSAYDWLLGTGYMLDPDDTDGDRPAIEVKRPRVADPHLITLMDEDGVGGDVEALPPLWIPLIGGNPGMPAP